jgi:outer membrane receptor protein involved in Fe transport
VKHLGSLFVLIVMCSHVAAQPNVTRTLSGVIVTQQDELLPGVTITVSYQSGEQKALSDGDGRFQFTVPHEALTARIEGKNIKPVEKRIYLSDATENLKFRVELIIPSIHESVVIAATALDPVIDRRNDTIYRSALFGRDDQLLQTLNAGINVGQHEGGGKSLEIRRFGYNLDHGGLNGGLKVLVDNVQQNHATQGHGQGYLGQLKSLTPELLEEVDILNGPFNAQYGDFSGLGVVHIRLRESLPEQLTMRFQGGSFDSRRMFLAYSPQLARAESFIAYEKSYLDGPFLNPARYKRDNLTGNYTYNLSADQALGFKLNLSRNDFFSSGQIPLDEVAAGRLDRFGFIDPNTGGRVRSGTFAAYYRKEWDDASQLKFDGFLSRSLFDLFSNFTFFLDDEVNGDAFVQHDSRLQAGGNVQYIHPYHLFGRQALLTAGGNIQAFKTNVRLAPAIGRAPIGVTTNADAQVTNTAGYVQQGIDLLRGHLHVDLGLRYDYFRFNVDDKISPEFSGTRAIGRSQPKVNISYTPTDRIPATFYFNYGRGINSQDARGVVRDAGTGPAIATTDFYQVGTSHTFKRISLSTDLFLIDHSDEQVYIPDDGSIEFAGPSRNYGYEVKASMQLTRHLAFSGGMTRVMNAFFRGTLPRVYVDSSPHLVGNAGLTLANFHGFSGSLQWRHVANYRLDGENASIRASGLDVVDLNVNKRVGRNVDLNFAVDNLFNKRYFETQNYFESRLRPGDPVVSRIHGTPGYPIGLTFGLTFRLSGK